MAKGKGKRKRKSSAKSAVAKTIKQREARYIKSTPSGGMGSGGRNKALSKYQGVTVGGKKYTRFSQFKSTPAKKKSLAEQTAGGIKLAIL